MRQPNDGYRPIPVALPPDGVFVFESHHRVGFSMPAERHDFHELFYVLDGGGAFHLAGQASPCACGGLVFVPAGVSHHIEDGPGTPLALYGIAVAPAVCRAEPGLFDRVPAGRLPIDPALAGQARADLQRLLFEQTHARPGSRTLVLGVTLQLLTQVARSAVAGEPDRRPGETPYRQAVERYVAELPHRFLEATDLDAAADEAGMSRRRFTQLFREVTGASWAAHVTRLRIDYACRLLRETSRSILSTAFECGYDDLSIFYRVFRRQTGLTPRAYREQSRPA
jgi:AraC family L-rhamnose operon regulatory protein RhaS